MTTDGKNEHNIMSNVCFIVVLCIYVIALCVGARYPVRYHYLCARLGAAPEEVGTGHHVIHGPHGHTHNNCIVITKLQNYSLQSQSYH